jgi:hypothetical protein
MKRALKTMALSAVVFVVMLLALEGLFRTTHFLGARRSWTEPDPGIGWRFTPGREYWYTGENDHPITGRINSLGWRDRERTREKPDGTYRIAVVGDSFVEAFQVDLDSTFVAIAERELNRGGAMPVEVLNMGRSGMTITEELDVLDEAVVGMSADLVVLVFVPRNDIADMNPVTADDVARPFVRVTESGELSIDTSFSRSAAYRAKRHMNALKQHSALLSLVAERINAFRLSRRRAVVANAGREGEITGALSLCTSSPDSLYAASMDVWMHVFSNAAADLSRRGGPDVLLVTVPMVYITEDIARFRAVDPTFDPGVFDENLSGEHQPYLGLQAPFEAEYRRTGNPLHWAHWNYDGHRLAGKLLARRVGEIHNNILFNN